MHMSSLVVDKARQLAAAGHHAEVIEYLGAQERSELADSPTLALLYGTAQARLGRNDEGLRWLDLALDEARRRDERAVEGQALNARGAIAVVRGRIDEAADYFTKALMIASRAPSMAATVKPAMLIPARHVANNRSGRPLSAPSASNAWLCTKRGTRLSLSEPAYSKLTNCRTSCWRWPDLAP